MPKNRERQRRNKKKDKLERRNAYGNLDLTPYNAVRVMNGLDIQLR